MKNPFILLLRLLISSAVIVLAAACSPEARKTKYLEAADRYYESADLDKAEVEYLNVLQLEPGNIQAISGLGLVYSDQGRLSRAVAYIRRGHEIQPDNLDLRVKMAQLHLAGGNLAGARAEATFVLERRPDDPDAALLLASTVTRPDEVSEIQTQLQSLPSPANTGAPVMTALAMLEIRQGRAAEAEAMLQQVLSEEPEFAAAHTLQGSLLLAKNDIEGGTRSLKLAADHSPLRSPRRLQYAQIQVRTGDAAGGRATLEEMTRATPDYVPAWIALAELSFLENKISESGDLIAKALMRDPENIEARLLSGRVRVVKGEHDQAIAEFVRLTEIFPGLPVPHFELARAHLAAGDVTRAIASLNQALTVAPNHADSVLMLASLNIRQGNHTGAVVVLRRLIPLRPDLLQAHLLLAEAYRAQGNFEDALGLYAHIAGQFPDYTGTPLARGQVLIQQGRREEAVAAFTQALALNPDNPTALEQLVDIDIRERRFAEARQRVTAEVAKNANLAGPGQLLLAKTYLAQNDMAQAELALRQAIELTPDNPTVYFLLAGVYHQNNQIPEALDRLGDVIERNPRDYAALMLSGVLQSQQGDQAAARGHYEQALTVNPRAMAALNNLAYIHAESFGEYDRAQELAQRARELAPTDPNVADTLGWILYSKGDYARALGLLLQAVEGLPQSAEVQYHVGMAHYMQGREEPARTALQRALEIDPEFPGAPRARQALAVIAIDPNPDDPGIRAGLERSLAENGSDPVALARLATFHERAGRPDQAISTLLTALQANPANVNVLISLARLHGSRQDTAKAMEYARSARQYAPGDPVVAHALGRLAYQMGDYTWANSLLHESTRRQSPAPELLVDYAESAYSVGRISEAEAALRDALNPPAGSGLNLTVSARTGEARQLLDLITLAANPPEAVAQSALIQRILGADPTHVPALMASGAAAEHRGDAAAATQAYEKALARFPDFAPAKLRLAILGSGREPIDQRTFDLALQARLAYPGDAELARALGIMNYRRRDFTRAVTMLRESASSRADDAPLFFFLGMAQMQTGDAIGARRSLERALSLGLGTDQAAEARQAIASLD